jgi:Zn-dependent protease
LLLLLVGVLVSLAVAGATLAAAATGVVLVGCVFAVVVLHELGHALVARRFGSSTRQILLLPIGGVASMDRMPERPRDELLVALAGPAVNVVLAGVLAVIIAASGASFDPAGAGTLGEALLGELLWINVSLAVFNLLPGFPMDGGRVLRALLAIRLGRARATRIAGAVGRLLAGVFVIAGLMWSPMLALIGVFVWFAGQQETAMAALQSALAGLTVADAMIRAPEVVDAGEPVDRAVDRMLSAGQHAIAVVDHGQLAGVVTEPDLASNLAIAGPHGAVADVMRRDVPTLAPTDTLASALERLQGEGVALVVDHDALVGMLTVEQLASFAALHARS